MTVSGKILQKALDKNKKIIRAKSRPHTYSTIYENKVGSTYENSECYGQLHNSYNTDEDPLLAIGDVSFTKNKNNNKDFLHWLWNESMFASLYCIKEYSDYEKNGQVINTTDFTASPALVALFAQRCACKITQMFVFNKLLELDFTIHQAFVLSNFLLYKQNYKYFYTSLNSVVMDISAKGLTIKQFINFFNEKKNNSAWIYTRPRKDFTWDGTNVIFAPQTGNNIHFHLLFPIKAKIIKSTWGDTEIKIVLFDKEKILAHIGAL